LCVASVSATTEEGLRRDEAVKFDVTSSSQRCGVFANEVAAGERFSLMSSKPITCSRGSSAAAKKREIAKPSSFSFASFF
jgi:hypothetical protein